MAAGNLQENWGEPVADIHVISAVRKSLEEVHVTHLSAGMISNGFIVS